MNFAKAVRSTEDIAGCLESGLQTLRGNSARVQVSNPRDLEGSVDIDHCLEAKFPTAPRWDYVLGYQDRVYYVEVHPASTGEVQTVLDKLRWLKVWRKPTPLETLRSQSSYHWIASGNIRIAKNSKYNRQLAQAGIGKPCRTLRLE